jgi:hypothetical protein
MSDLDLIKEEINDTKKKLEDANNASDYARRGRLEELLTEQTSVWKQLLENAGKFQASPLCIHC